MDIGDNGALRIVFYENDSDIDGNVFQYGYCIDDMKRIVVGMTRASGAILGIRLLELLKKARVETHLVISEYGEKTILAETDRSVREVLSLADRTYDNGDLFAAIASGSFQFDAMVICPCSMKTLAAIYTGLSDSLITRAADVCIKERRKLILLPRETPLSPIHLRNMQYLSEISVSILPPMMTFYTDPVCIEDMIGQILLKVLDQIGLEHASGRRWSGMPDESRPQKEQ